MEIDCVSIRGYQDEDKEKCRILWCELTEHHREIYNDSSIGGTDPSHYFDEHLKRVSPQRIWVAEKAGEMVGMVGLIEGEEVEIEPVVAKRTHRQKGIGKLLL